MDYVREPFDGVIPLEQIQGLGKSSKKQTDTVVSSDEKTPAKPVVSQKNGVTMTGEPADKVVINPNIPPLTESTGTHAVMAFGRYNPPTVGHEKLINKVKDVAKEHNASAHVIASHSEGNSKNPLPQDKKVGYLKKVAGEGVHVSGSSKDKPTFLHHAAELYKSGVRHLHVVAGSDRVEDYKSKLAKYNDGKEHAHGSYKFHSITVHSSGARDPDAEGSEGMSGTKMRELAHAGKHKEFKAGLPKALHPHAKEIADHIRSIKEEVIVEASKLSSLDKWRAAAAEREKKHDEFERKRKEDAAKGKENMSSTIDRLAARLKEDLDENVSLQNRMGRANRMRRNAAKLKQARAIARKRLAKTSNMRRRALKRARQLMRQRLAGDRGKKYSQLTRSDKIAVDRMADKRKKQIARIANRLGPRVKRDEVQRLAAVAAGKRVSNSPTPIVSSYELPNMSTITEKAAIALKFKALKSNIEFDTIVEVFSRGLQSYPNDAQLTPHQFAFARVNSFITGGKAATELDIDLAERKTVQYTARDMVNTDPENLPKVHSFAQHSQIVADIKAEKDPFKQARKKAELIRRATGEMSRKIIESSVYTRVANKIVRAKSPQLANMKKNIVAALKKKDYETLANIIMYLAKDKLGSNVRIQQEATEVSSQKRLSTMAHKQGQHVQGNIRANIASAVKRGDNTSADALRRAIEARKAAAKPFTHEDVCVPEEDYIYEEWTEEQWNTLIEENNEGRTLNKPFRTSGGPKKFAVYVKNDKGNIIKLGFGDPNLEIKRDDPDRRKAYRARHGCDNPGPKWKANYWSCNWSWSASKKVGA